MTQIKKVKTTLGVTYLILVAFVVFAFFYWEIYKYFAPEFIRAHRPEIIAFKHAHFTFLLLSFFIFGIIWVFLLGFGTPLSITSGIIFGPIWGSIVAILSEAIGASCLYVFANIYFKETVFKYLNKRYKKLTKHFRENELSYFTFLRLIPGIPYQIMNLLPVLFNMRLENYFLATIIGTAPMTIIVVSISSGIAARFEGGERLSLAMIQQPRIYLPIIVLGIVVLLLNFAKKKFFKN